MRTRVVIQSRLNSSRLPGKAMMTVGGMPLIELVARRATRNRHEVVVATSREEYDQRIADHLGRQGIEVLRGSLDNVLSRFIAATADMDDTDRVVRLTGDNPVVDADLVDELIAAVDASSHSYGRVDLARAPEGLGVEVCTVGNLREAAAKATSAYDHEHVTPWIRRNLGELAWAPEGIDFDIVTYRCTIDSLADYVRIAQLFDGYADPIGVSWRDLVASIARQVAISGTALPRTSRGGLTLSRLLLGASQMGRDSGAVERRQPDAAEARAILSAAVARGITHVVAGRDDGASEAAVRVAYDPALRQRVGVLTTVRALAGVPDEALSYAVEASLERSFAELGRRRADAVLFVGADDALAGDGAAWRRLQDYQSAGDVGQVGVLLDDPADIARVKDLPGLGYLAIPFSVVDRRANDVVDDLSVLAEAGVVITVHSTFAQGVLTSRAPLAEDAPPEAAALRAAVEGAAAALGRTDAVELCLAYASAPSWVTAVVVGVETADELVQAMGQGASRPLSAWEVERVHQLVPAADEEFHDWLARV